MLPSTYERWRTTEQGRVRIFLPTSAVIKLWLAQYKLLPGRDRYRDYLDILLTNVKNAPVTSSDVGGEEKRYMQQLYNVYLPPSGRNAVGTVGGAAASL